jgi:hypothetical protein
MSTLNLEVRIGNKKTALDLIQRRLAYSVVVL